MLASLSEFKFFQQFRVPVQEADDIRFLVEREEGSQERTTYIEGARLVDLSVMGLGFATSEKLKVGTDLSISLQFRKQHLDITGRVVRSFSSSIHDDELIYGVSLEEDHDLKKFLEQFIYSFSQDRLRDCLIQSALTEKYTTAHEGFEMFSLLLSLFNDMSKFGDQKDFVDNMLEEVCRILNAKRASLFLINTETNELEAVSALGMDSEVLKFDYRLGIAGSVFTTGVSLNIETVKDKCRFDSFFDSITGFTTKSIICHPIHNREDKVIGVIEVLNKRNEDRFSVEDEKVMKVVALVFSSLFHNFNPLSESSQIRRFSTPFDREYALIGQSDFINGLRSVIIKLKDVDTSLLVEGAMGTGKTLLSKILHYEGKRGLKTYDVLDCAMTDPESLSIELFGAGPKISKLELCKGGTLVLCNIDRLSLEMQKRLYNVLVQGKLPEGQMDLDIKLVATTTRHLPKLVESGDFYKHLYEYFSKSFIEMQPLRKRKEDIPDLVNYFLKLECKREGLLVKTVSPAAMEKLQDYDWPGNISELRTCIERMVLYNPKTHVISNLKSFPTPLFDHKKSSTPLYDIPYASDSKLALKDRVALVEREIILSELKRHNGNKSQASESMKLSRESLRKKLLHSEKVLERIKKLKNSAASKSEKSPKEKTSIKSAA